MFKFLHTFWRFKIKKVSWISAGHFLQSMDWIAWIGLQRLYNPWIGIAQSLEIYPTSPFFKIAKSQSMDWDLCNPVKSIQQAPVSGLGFPIHGLQSTNQLHWIGGIGKTSLFTLTNHFLQNFRRCFHLFDQLFGQH